MFFRYMSYFQKHLKLMRPAFFTKRITLTCLIACIALGGCTFGRKTTTVENVNAKNIEQPDAGNAIGNKGYLANGPTIRVETNTTKSKGTIIEQLEDTSKELQENNELLRTLKKEFEKLKISKEVLLVELEVLQVELKDNNEKLVIAQHLLVENETLNNEVERLSTDLSALRTQIKQLNGELLKVQISEVKTQQELVMAQIQHLQGKKEENNQ